MRVYTLPHLRGRRGAITRAIYLVCAVLTLFALAGAQAAWSKAHPARPTR